MNRHPEDDDIIKLFKKGGNHTNTAFNQLVVKHGDILYRQIRGITKNHEFTNDVLQNVLVKVFKNLKNFKGDSALYTWMYRIARNESLNFLDKEKRRTGIDIDPPVLELLYGHSTLDSMTSETISELLNRAVNTLPEKQAVVFQLKYFEDMKYSEISKRLNTSEGALKANFHHAKQKIEKYILDQLNH